MTDVTEERIEFARALLLDFDGPICRLFAGYSAADVAHDLRAFIQGCGAVVPSELQRPDPLELFRAMAGARPDLGSDIESRLIDAERTAVRIARPTPHAHDLIVTVARRQTPVAIVSNNSTEAIDDYLEQHGLSGYITAVIGRPRGRPHLMKPHPYTLFQAIHSLGAQPHESTFVGDSLSDIEAAQRAHTRSIGYATNPSRVSSLANAGADAVIETIDALLPRPDEFT